MADARVSNIAGNVGVRIFPVFDGIGKAMADGARKEGREAGKAYAEGYSEASKVSAADQRKMQAARKAEADAINDVTKAEKALAAARKTGGMSSAKVEADFAKARADVAKVTNTLTAAEENRARVGRDMARIEGEVANARDRSAKATKELQKAENLLTAANASGREERIAKASREHAAAKEQAEKATLALSEAEARLTPQIAKQEAAERKLAAARLKSADAANALNVASERHEALARGEEVSTERIAAAQTRLSDARLAHAAVLDKYSGDLRRANEVDAESIRMAKAKADADWNAMSRRERVMKTIDQNISKLAQESRAYASLRRIIDGMRANDIHINTFFNGNGIRKATQEFGELSIAVASTLMRLGSVLYLVPTITSLLVPLGSAAIFAAGGLAQMAAGLGAGLGVAVIALRPVVAAFQAMSQAEKTASTDAENAAKAQSNASRQIASAKKGVADAARAAAQATRAALNAQEQAEGRVATAQKSAKRAQDELTKARKDAVQQLKDMRQEVTDAALDERSAALAVARARENLRTTNTDPKASELDRQEAALAVDQALNEQKKTREKASETRSKAATAARKGVEGSDAVVSAKASVSDANANVVQAQRDLAQAIAEVNRTRVEGAQRVSEAQARVKDAQDAAALTSAKLATNQRNLQQAMDNLSPAGKRLTEMLYAANNGLNELSKKSQERMFPGFIAGLQALQPLYPGFESFILNMSSRMGKVAEDSAKALNSDRWKGIGNTFARDLPVAFTNGSQVIGNVLTGLMTILAALSPSFTDLSKSMADGSKRFSDWSAEWVKSDGFKSFVDKLKADLPKVTRFIAAASKAIGNLIRALSDSGDSNLDGISGFLEGIANMDEADLKKKIDAIVNAGKAMIALGAAMKFLRVGTDTAMLVGRIAGIGSAADDSGSKISKMLKALKGGGGAEAAAGGAAMGRAFGMIGAGGGAAGASGAAASGGLLAAIGPLLPAIGIAALVVGLIAALVVAYQKCDWFREKVNGFVSSIGTIIKEDWAAIWSSLGPKVDGSIRGAKIVIEAGLNGIGTFWNNWGDTIQGILKGLVDSIGAIFQGLFKVVGGIFKAGFGLLTGDTSLALDGIKSVFDGFKTAGEGVFNGLMDSISAAFKKLPGFAKAPVKWVVDNVVNKLIDVVNTVSGALGAPLNLKHVTMEDAPAAPGGSDKAATKKRVSTKSALMDRRGYAVGGYVAGWSPNDSADNIPAMLTAGEHVIKRRSVISMEKTAPGMLDYINEHGALPGFANGGRVWPGPIKALSNNYVGHSGIDIRDPLNTPVFAAADGTVYYIGTGKGYGKAIFQNVGDGLQAVYGHLSSYAVQAGQAVKAGQTIGMSGNTGNSSGPHLHFEVNTSGSFDRTANRAGTLAWLGGAALQGMQDKPNEAVSLNPMDKLRDVAADATEWLFNGSKVALGLIPKMFGGSAIAKIASSAGFKLIQAAQEAMKSKAATDPLANASDTGDNSAANYVASGGAKQWTEAARAALIREGVSVDYLPLMLHRIQVESGGNPRAINNWDSNAKRGTPSMGLMQTIRPTFEAYRNKSLPDDPYNPDANLSAAIRYTRARYKGNFHKAWGGTSGYADGGLVEALDMPRIAWDINPGTTGYLPPGFSLAYNGTGAPEPLTRGQGGGNSGIVLDHPTFVNNNSREVVDELFFKVRRARLNGVYQGAR